MDLKKCKILLDAIDCRNLSKVAKDYGYTPSGVWHMIDAIENELGFPLFLRGSGGVTPTDNCLRITPELRELVKCSERFSRKMEEIRGMESGSVTIGSYPSISIQWLPHVIKAFRADYPGIRIQIREGHPAGAAKLARRRQRRDVLLHGAPRHEGRVDSAF